eukprot:6197779-Pleurochrysis_carterae.AAC.1
MSISCPHLARPVGSSRSPAVRQQHTAIRPTALALRTAAEVPCTDCSRARAATAARCRST